MKELFRKYQAVLRFLLIFLGSYILLSLLYGGFLSLSRGEEATPDVITQNVAKQSTALLNSLGYVSKVAANKDLPSLQLWVEGTQVGTIIEGCNSLSIIILFMSFVVAFSGPIKKTVVFLFAGAVLIYSVNLVRIAILAIALYQYPQYQEPLHTIVFPGIIYGLVFVLWVIWVKSLNKTKKANSSFEGGKGDIYE
ncbi:MAG: exosortase family protein XrtF [Flavobacteriaceae bacterium]|nr:exosortase family protein XrtF [Flavobacteriaceae bacterium]